MDYENKIDIPFGAFDSELYYQEIHIPDGFEATIKDNKVILKRKESEDEKVREALIELVKCNERSGYLVLNNVSTGSMIAWLEKQGKQNLTSNNKRAWLHIVADVLTWKDGIGQYLDDPRVQKLANTFANTFTIYSKSSNIGKNKQEPADTDEVKLNFHEGGEH